MIPIMLSITFGFAISVFFGFGTILWIRGASLGGYHVWYCSAGALLHGIGLTSLTMYFTLAFHTELIKILKVL